MVNRILRTAGALQLLVPLLCGSPILTVIPPDGGISGSPGATVGWGYSLTNDNPTDWYVPTSLNSGSFLHATPALLFDFPVLAPESGVSVAFDPATGLGRFGEFHLRIVGWQNTARQCTANTQQ